MCIGRSPRRRRSMSHGGRRCSSIARAARHHSDRRSTAARPRSRRLVDVRGLGSSRFARGIGYVCRRREVQDVCVRAHQQSSSAAVRPRRTMSHGAVDVRRSQVLRGAASLGPLLDRSTASQQAAGRRCLRRCFVRGAWGRPSSCRSFCRRRAVPDRKRAIEKATWSRPTWGVLVNAIDSISVRKTDSV